jgi:hypothetical protein
VEELIVFPDPIPAIRSAWLDNRATLGYSTVGIYGAVPDPRPSRFVRLLRTGGARQWPVIDNVMVTIEAWAESDAHAALLAQSVRAVVNAMQGTVVDTVTIYTVTEFSGPANVPDPVSNQPRHSWTVELACRGASAPASA